MNEMHDKLLAAAKTLIKEMNADAPNYIWIANARVKLEEAIAKMEAK